MKIVVISASPRKNANTQYMMKFVYDYTKSKDHNVKFINLSEGVDYYHGPEASYSESTKQAAKDLTEADIWLIGSPIYNSFLSSALKNLFEFINYKETPGKVAGISIIASGEIGFINVQNLITQLMSYFRIITNPRAVFMTAKMIENGAVKDEDAQARLREMVDETVSLAAKLR
jgi:NAD(P)H-dependent FMN reductase